MADEMDFSDLLSSLKELGPGLDPFSLKSSKRRAKIFPTKYDKLNPEKKNKAVDLMYQCALNGFEDKVMELVTCGVPVDQKVKGGLSTIHVLAKEGHVNIMLKMIIHHHKPPVDLDNKDLSFEDKLRSLKSSKDEVTKKLSFLWKNKTKLGWRPLHLAIQSGHLDVVELLLQVHMDDSLLSTTSKIRKGGNKCGKVSPIHIAAQCGSVPALELMWRWCEVMREGDTRYQLFGEQDGKGWNALHHAAAHGHYDVVQWLVQRKEEGRLDLEARSEKGHTPLLTGVVYKKSSICELFISYKSDITATANDGMTALHFAAMNDDLEIARKLVDMDKSLCMKQDNNGDTPLHIANKKFSTEVSGFLQESDRMTLEIENKNGHTPITIPPEDGEYIPLEIRKRGKQAIKIYKDALSHGEMQIPHVKLVVLGEARHGKTSLLKLLEGLEFEPNRESTEGIECELVTTKTIDGRSWGSDGQSHLTPLADLLRDELKKVPKEDISKAKGKPQDKPLTKEEVDREIKALFPPLTKPQPRLFGSLLGSGDVQKTRQPFVTGRSSIPSSSPARYQPDQEKIVPSHPGRDEVVRGPPKSSPAKTTPPPREARMETDDPQPTDPPEDQPTTTPTAPPTSPPTVTPNRGIGKHVERALSRRDDGDDSQRILFTTYDFAGEDLYRPMHHCFITQRSMFLIVYNTREFLKGGEINDEVRHKYIKYWFNTVSAYTQPQGKLKKKPPVFLVGTHRGPYDEAEGFEQMPPEQQKKIKEELSQLKKSQRYKYHLMTSGPFHFVESSIPDEHDSGAEDLKSILQEVALALPFISDKYPVQWMQLQSKLENRELVTIEEVREMSGFDDDQLDLALKFFHDIGVITNPRLIPKIFLPEEDRQKLEGIILCGPQRLADKMKELIHPDKHINRLNADESDLLESHIATRGSLRKIFSGEKDPINDKYLDYICLFLRAYGLIFPMDRARREDMADDSSEDPQFLVPCRLQELDEKDHGVPPLVVKRYLSFEVDFNGYLPDEVFVRFICLAASESTSALRLPDWENAQYVLANNYCNVDDWKEKGDKWEIWRKESAMELVVTPPHGYSGDLVEFPLFAVTKIEELCKGLGIEDLPHYSGKRRLCSHCEKVMFQTLKRVEGTWVLSCSCNCGLDLESELKKEFNDPSYRLDKKPTEKDLRRHVVSKASDVWMKVCTELGIPFNYQKNARRESSGDTEGAFFDCLVHWLGGNVEDSPVKWRTVLEALKESDKVELAKGIEDILKADKH